MRTLKPLIAKAAANVSNEVAGVEHSKEVPNRTLKRQQSNKDLKPDKETPSIKRACPSSPTRTATKVADSRKPGSRSGIRRGSRQSTRQSSQNTSATSRRPSTQDPSPNAGKLLLNNSEKVCVRMPSVFNFMDF